MDHLLLACRSSSLNMFVESFLRMVNTLLESSQPDLQIAATSSVSMVGCFGAAEGSIACFKGIDICIFSCCETRGIH